MKMEISERARKQLERARAEARRRVIERGLVQFRASEQMMEQLLVVAEHRNMPAGALVRSWIEPILAREYEDLPLKEVMLPTGNVLSPDTGARRLEQVLADCEAGRLKLSKKEISAIREWRRSEPSTTGLLTEVMLPDGRVLTPESSVSELTAVYDAHKRGKLDLKSREFNAIVDWAMQQAERRI